MGYRAWLSDSKVMALVAAMVMVLSLGVTAMAAEVSASITYADGDGAITVNNAVKGETYYAIKVLNATVSDDGIAYYADEIPEDLEDVLAIKTITRDDGTEYQVIEQKEGVSVDDYQDAMRRFANTNKAFWGEGIMCTGNSVTFNDLDLGFYVIVSTLNGVETNKVSAGSTYAEGKGAAGQVYEKNETSVEVKKEADHESYAIGDTVTYTVTFNGVNYVGADKEAEIIVKYEVIDTLPEFLSDAKVVQVVVGDDDVTNDLEGADEFDKNKRFFIPWADGSHDAGYTSKYTNGTSITIIYTATLTDVVKIDGATGNKNTVEIKPYVDTNEGEPQPREKKWTASDKIFTYAAALKKTDGTKTLAGAKFKFEGLTVESAEGYTKGVYVVTGLATAGEDSEVEVGDDGMLYIIGLANDDVLTGTETVAPNGFNLLTSEFELKPQEMGHEIWSSEGTRYYDEDGNLVAEESSFTSSENVTMTITDLNAEALEVVNNAGSELPSTGGIGTTIFYVAGAILILGAGVLLITRRRMKNV